MLHGFSMLRSPLAHKGKCMSFAQSVAFNHRGRRFYVLIGNEILPGMKTHIGFAVKHESASGGNFNYHELALERLRTGKYKYELEAIDGKVFGFLLSQTFLADRIIAWLESEGVIHRPGSVKDILRRGEVLSTYAPSPESASFEATMGRSKYVAWRTQATTLVQRLPEGDERRVQIEELLTRMPGPVVAQAEQPQGEAAVVQAEQTTV